jgi:hypothetical protein
LKPICGPPTNSGDPVCVAAPLAMRTLLASWRGANWSAPAARVEGRELRRRGLEAAVGDAHHPARLGHADLRLVGEAAVRRGRGLGVIAAAEVLVGLVAARRPELGAQRIEELRVGGLCPAALAQELRLDRVQRVDVGAGELRRAGPVLRVPEVQPREVDVDVAQQLHAARPGGLDRLRLQRGRLIDHRLRRLVAVEPEDQADGRHAQHADQRGDAVGAREIDDEAAVLRLDVAGTEDHPGVGVAVDVRYAVRVALDARADGAGARRGAADGLRDQERGIVLVHQRGRLVEAGAVGAGDELSVGDVAEQRRQAVVHARLGLGGEQPRSRAPADAGLPLAVRDDVQGGRRRGSRRHGAEHDRGERERASQDLSSLMTESRRGAAGRRAR